MRFWFGLLVALTVATVVGIAACTDGDSDKAPGDYAWGTPETIGVEGSAQEVPLAVNADGFAIAAWAQGAEGALWANRYVPNNGWESPERIETGGFGATNPEVAIAPNGTAMLVWQEYANPEEIRASHYTPSGGWGPAMPVDPGPHGGAYDPHVAMDGSGNAIAAWHQVDAQGDGVVMAARYTPGNEWAAPQPIDSGTAEYDSRPRVAMDPHGNAVAVWYGADDEGGRIFASHYSPASGWAGAQRINSPTDGGAGQPDVDMDASGNAIAVWAQDYEGDRWTRRISVNRFTPGDGWGTADSFESGDSWYPDVPQVSVNAGGTAMVVWQRVETSGGSDTIWSARYEPSSDWQPEERVDAERSGYYDRYPQVAVDRFGHALAVWEGSASTNTSVWSSHYTAEDGWDRSVRLDLGLLAQGPQVGVDARGKGVAAWVQGTASNSGVWANRYSDDPVEDNTATWQAMCDAGCERASECSLLGEGTVAECVSECMGEFQGWACDPNQGALENCVDDLDDWLCRDIEFGYLPYSCTLACAGNSLCEGHVCDDLNDCTVGSCDPAEGGCRFTPVDDGTPCADGAGTCQQGQCDVP